MTNHARIEGFWYIDGGDKPPFFGVLTVDLQNGVSLEVKGMSRGGDKIAHFERLIAKRPDTPIAIQGYDDKAKPIMLFDCMEEEIVASAGMETKRFSVQRAVIGLEGGEWSQLTCSKVRLRLSLLNCWMNPINAVSNRPHESISYDLDGIGRMEIWAAHSIGGNGARSEVWWLDFKPDQEWRVCFTDLHLKHEIALLLTLLTSFRVVTDELAFEIAGSKSPRADYFTILQANGDDGTFRRTELPIYMRTTHRDVSYSFGKIVSRWFHLARDTEFKEIIRLYAVAKTQPLPISVSFLLVAQALEAYHTASRKFSSTKRPKEEVRSLMQRIKVALSFEDFEEVRACLANMNNKSFLEKLTEIIAIAPPQFSRIVVDAEPFARAVRDNRNAHTHHVGSTSNKKKLNSFQLAALDDKAMALLEMLLLKDVEAPESAIDHIVKEHAGVVRVEFNAEDDE